MYMLIIAIIIIILIPKALEENKLKKEELNELKKRQEKIKENSFYHTDFKRKLRDLRLKGYETSGVYILTNTSNNRKYIGQSKNLIKRINTHLSYKGSPDVAKDMRKGDEFIIELIKTEVPNLNYLERYYISKFNTFEQGYNKTRGNR